MKNILEKLNIKVKISNIYLLSLLLLTIASIVVSYTYALFTSSSTKSNAVSIVTGSLISTIESKDIDSSKNITVKADTSNFIMLKLINQNSINAKFNLYYSSSNDLTNVKVGYSSLGDQYNVADGVVITKNTSTDNTKLMVVRIDNNSDNDVTIIFGSNVGLDSTSLSVPEGKTLVKSLYNCNSSDVICINSTDELRTLATEVNAGDTKEGKTVWLKNDLDLGGKFDENGNELANNVSWTPIGNDYSTTFNGFFDGDGHIISNLYINNNSSGQGLFGRTANSTVKNLMLSNSYIKSGGESGSVIGEGSSLIENLIVDVKIKGIEGHCAYGGIIGSAHGEVRNSINKGELSINQRSDNESMAGGIAGWNSSIIKNSYNLASISSTGKGTGGIVGWDFNSLISNTYNLSNISSAGNIGGIVGYMQTAGAIIKDSYNKGILTKTTTTGGIAGVYDSSVTQPLSNNFYLSTTATYGVGSTLSNENASPLLESEMPTVLSVVNGDNAFVEDTYNINNGYPILKWQAIREELK